MLHMLVGHEMHDAEADSKYLPAVHASKPAHELVTVLPARHVKVHCEMRPCSLYLLLAHAWHNVSV